MTPARPPGPPTATALPGVAARSPGRERHTTPAPAAAPRRPRALAAWVLRFHRHLPDRLHAGGDAIARQHGWTITPTAGRFGFAGRTYRDPRFAHRAATAPGPVAQDGEPSR